MPAKFFFHPTSGKMYAEQTVQTQQYIRIEIVSIHRFSKSDISSSKPMHTIQICIIKFLLRPIIA